MNVCMGIRGVVIIEENELLENAKAHHCDDGTETLLVFRILVQISRTCFVAIRNTVSTAISISVQGQPVPYQN